MANYNKSFNFRNGVQVDDDNFIVNANGLVGIGTSVPTEFLDVHGTAKITGLVTATSIFTPDLSVSGIATIATLKVGIVTASSGIVTYYGDGSKLSNLSTSQWVNVNTGIGVTSIYAAGAVGVATNYPTYYFQVGSNPDTQSGVGINSTGSIKVSGIITASSFSGSGTGISSINADNISLGTLSNLRLPTNINVSGVITATSGFNGNLTGNATSATNFNGTPNISVGTVNASSITATGIISSTNSIIGISTISTLLNVNGSLGIGTNIPNANVHIRNSSGSSLQLTSDGSNESYITLGRSTARIQNNGEIRFGYNLSLYPYSTSSSLDIINYGIGNVNNYLQLGSAGIGTGSFNWIFGQNQSNLMTLTYDGKLGIGITLPKNNLHVVGIATVQGDSYVSGNLSVNGSFNIGTLNVTTLTGNLSGNLLGNVYTTSGISTFYKIQSLSLASFDSINSNFIGIGTTSSSFVFQVNNNSNSVVINSLGSIGIQTTKISTFNSFPTAIDASRGIAYIQGVGIGTTTPKSYSDFSNAGNVGSGLYQFMLPPVVTTTQRTGLSTAEGAFIYNSTTKRHQGYNGTAWFDFY